MWTFVFQRKIRRSLTQLLDALRTHPGTRGALRDPLVRQRLAQAHIEVELLRLAGYRSLTTLLRSGHPGPESSLEKVLGSETDQRLQDLAMSLFGPYATEIQRNVIAQRILGLPR